jgi:hypothetical protein
VARCEKCRNGATTGADADKAKASGCGCRGEARGVSETRKE